MSTTQPSATSTGAVSGGARTAHLAVVGLASLVVLSQAVWAGLLIQDDRTTGSRSTPGAPPCCWSSRPTSAAGSAHSTLTVIRSLPGMALMALSVWLPMRATRGRD